MFPLNTRILIADDMKSITDLLKMHLKELGFENIQVATDGAKTIEILNRGANTRQPIELIICDWNMPIKTGLEILQFIRSNDTYKKCPFIMVTSESEREQVAQAVLEGVSHYIVKPFTGKVIKERLTSVYAARTPDKN